MLQTCSWLEGFGGCSSCAFEPGTSFHWTCSRFPEAYCEITWYRECSNQICPRVNGRIRGFFNSASMLKSGVNGRRMLKQHHSISSRTSLFPLLLLTSIYHYFKTLNSDNVKTLFAMQGCDFCPYPRINDRGCSQVGSDTFGQRTRLLERTPRWDGMNKRQFKSLPIMNLAITFHFASYSKPFRAHWAINLDGRPHWSHKNRFLKYIKETEVR